MIDTQSIQRNAEASATLAAAVAEYEARFGKVETLPIRIGEVITPFRIRCPEKPRAEEQPVKKRGNSSRANVISARENMEAIRALASTGANTCAISESTGLTRKYIQHIASKHKIALPK